MRLITQIFDQLNLLTGNILLYSGGTQSGLTAMLDLLHGWAILHEFVVLKQKLMQNDLRKLYFLITNLSNIINHYFKMTNVLYLGPKTLKKPEILLGFACFFDKK